MAIRQVRLRRAIVPELVASGAGFRASRFGTWPQYKCSVRRQFHGVAHLGILPCWPANDVRMSRRDIVRINFQSAGDDISWAYYGPSLGVRFDAERRKFTDIGFRETFDPKHRQLPCFFLGHEGAPSRFEWIDPKMTFSEIEELGQWFSRGKRFDKRLLSHGRVALESGAVAEESPLGISRCHALDLRRTRPRSSGGRRR